jgi:hypothetical protein
MSKDLAIDGRAVDSGDYRLQVSLVGGPRSSGPTSRKVISKIFPLAVRGSAAGSRRSEVALSTL